MRLGSPSVPSELHTYPHSPLDIVLPPLPSPPPLLSSPGPWDLTKLTSDFHEAYHRFEDITSFFNDLARTFPHQTELVRVGQSAEGREILAIKIEQVGSVFGLPLLGCDKVLTDLVLNVYSPAGGRYGPVSSYRVRSTRAT